MSLKIILIYLVLYGTPTFPQHCNHEIETLNFFLQASNYVDSHANKNSHASSGRVVPCFLSTSQMKNSFVLFTKGKNGVEWVKAINCEMDSVLRDETWTPVSRSNDWKILTTEWVFRCKGALDENSIKVEKYKARLVSRGLEQVHRTNHSETFAPVVTFTTLCLFFGMVAVEDFKLHQMDVKTALLHGKL